MNDLIIIVIRFFLYLDLVILFGLPFSQTYGINGVRNEMYNLVNFRSLIVLVVLISILLTGVNTLPVSSTMSGVTDLRKLFIHTIEMVVGETDVGISRVVRLFTLSIILGGLFPYTKNRVLFCLLMTINGAVMLATLAWGERAVMYDGVHYYLHLLSGLIHLGAVGVWAGALAASVILLMRKDDHSVRSVSIISDSLARFATAETTIVVALSLSAPVNYLYIARDELAPLFNNAWGNALLTKTALFILMLPLIAANRFRLSPRLEIMIGGGNYIHNVMLIRNSILTEFVIAVTILGTASWLGMLAPSQASWDTEGVSRKILTIVPTNELYSVY